MEFGWSPAQLEFRQAVADFARRALRDDLLQRDKQSEFSRELWNRCAEFGIQGLPFPEEYGGGGMSILDTVLAMETLGSVCGDNGLLFGLAAQLWSVQMPIFRFGTPEQKARYLPGLINGTLIGAHGMSEPDSGSDAFSLRTSAVRQGDHYVLNGAKTFVSEAPVADLFVVFATLDRGKGVLGITAFVVEKDAPGFRVGKQIGKMGLKTSPMGELVFEDCRVPAGNLLGREGRGANIFNDSMDWERGLILACAVGAMARQLETACKYAREREQFGQSIGTFQAISHKLADMRLRLEAARMLLYKAAWLRDQGQQAGVDAALAKLFISEAWLQTALDAVQLHGGYGYTTEYEVERDLRDAIGGRLYSGTSEIQRNLIARKLGFGS